MGAFLSVGIRFLSWQVSACETNLSREVEGTSPNFWNAGAIMIFCGGLDIPGGGHGADAPDE